VARHYRLPPKIPGDQEKEKNRSLKNRNRILERENRKLQSENRTLRRAWERSEARLREAFGSTPLEDLISPDLAEEGEGGDG
jgi:cell division protein FtsB